jgi:patatin-like phospholipase/acyl hydrolase
MEKKTIRVLSIDGGGIRGIFPAKFLAEIEGELEAKGAEKKQIFEHFDLITGTSTGGILAIGLALGIPALKLYNLYKESAGEIFGDKKCFLKQLLHSAHDRGNLEMLLRKEFQAANGGIDPRLADCKTGVCVPVYDLMEGRASVLKSRYHPAFNRDYHIPAFQAALATAAAPTFFDPYSASYKDQKGIEQTFSNKVDGGVFANNPALLGIIEAQKAFDVSLSQLEVLSIGTGHQKFNDACARSKWGISYWINGKRKRIIELFMQGQSQQVQNLISLLQKGIDKQEGENFLYTRIDTELDNTCMIELDETCPIKLGKLAEKAQKAFQDHGNAVLKHFFAPKYVEKE